MEGFDPTHGILTQTDHVRVAVGRNYVDATPTSGTIYVGGGSETLTVDVSVVPVVPVNASDTAEFVTLYGGVLLRLRAPRLDASRRSRSKWIIRPRVSRIATAQFFPHVEIR